MLLRNGPIYVSTIYTIYAGNFCFYFFLFFIRRCLTVVQQGSHWYHYEGIVGLFISCFTVEGIIRVHIANGRGVGTWIKGLLATRLVIVRRVALYGDHVCEQQQRGEIVYRYCGMLAISFYVIHFYFCPIRRFITRSTVKVTMIVIRYGRTMSIYGLYRVQRYTFILYSNIIVTGVTMMFRGLYSFC